MLPAYPTGEVQAVFRRRAMELMELFSVSRHAASIKPSRSRRLNAVSRDPGFTLNT